MASYTARATDSLPPLRAELLERPLIGELCLHRGELRADRVSVATSRSEAEVMTVGDCSTTKTLSHLRARPETAIAIGLPRLAVGERGKEL